MRGGGRRQDVAAHRAAGVRPLRQTRAVERVVAHGGEHAGDVVVQPLQAHGAVRQLRLPRRETETRVVVVLLLALRQQLHRLDEQDGAYLRLHAAELCVPTRPAGVRRAYKLKAKRRIDSTYCSRTHFHASASSMIAASERQRRHATGVPPRVRSVSVLRERAGRSGGCGGGAYGSAGQAPVAVVRRVLRVEGDEHCVPRVGVRSLVAHDAHLPHVAQQP